MDEKFIQTIQDTIDGSETILGVVISGSKGEFAFERERGTVISWVDNSPRFVPRFAVTKPPKYLPLRIEGQRNVNIQAVSGYLDYALGIEILKRTLLIVLVSLTLAFFTLLMDALLTKNTAKAGETAPPSPITGNPPGSFAGGSAVVSGPVEINEKEAPGVQKKPSGGNPEETEAEIVETAKAGEKEIPGNGDPGWEAEDFDFENEDNIPDFEDDKNPQPVKAEAPKIVAENPAPEPRGLFSPRGNVGWESYAEERLESELRRGASTEQDLVLIATAFKEPEKLSGEQFRCFAEEAVHYFEHRDLIFEYGERGLWIIHPNHSLEQGLAASREFNSRILSKLPRPAGSAVDLRFGISSRSGRLINAGRIMIEAGEALKRAAEDPGSHIIAFKSDPEKYRQYISGQNPRNA
jgi:hypothetical protein